MKRIIFALSLLTNHLQITQNPLTIRKVEQ